MKMWPPRCPPTGGVVNHGELELVGSGTYAGAISGVGALLKSNGGTLTLTGINTYSGGTTIQSGRLRVNANSLPDTNMVVNNSELEFNQIDSGNFAGVISGSGEVIKTGTGTLTLSNGLNSYAGDTLIEEGALTLGSSNVLAEHHQRDRQWRPVQPGREDRYDPQPDTQRRQWSRIS